MVLAHISISGNAQDRKAECDQSANVAVEAARYRDSGLDKETTKMKLSERYSGQGLDWGIGSAFGFTALRGLPLFYFESLYCGVAPKDGKAFSEFQRMLLKTIYDQVLACQNRGQIEKEAFLACMKQQP